jgi:hypothetical protein
MSEPRIATPPSKNKYDWDAVARLVAEAAGEWVLINTDGPANSSIRYALERGNMRAMRPPEKYQYTTRNNTQSPNRTCDIYVRLNPDYKE